MTYHQAKEMFKEFRIVKGANFVIIKEDYDYIIKKIYEDFNDKHNPKDEFRRIFHD